MSILQNCCLKLLGWFVLSCLIGGAQASAGVGGELRGIYSNTFDLGTSVSEYVDSAFFDNDGSIVLYGKHYGTNGIDLLAVSFSPEGTTNWFIHYDSPFHGNDEVIDAQMDSMGNYLFCLQSQTASGDTDVVVLKYGSTGTLLWENWYDSGIFSNEFPFAFDLDLAGNVYVGGTGISTASPGAAMLVYKCSPQGSNEWARIWNAPNGAGKVGYVSMSSLEVSSTGEVYASCNWSWHYSSAQSIKYDADGNILWEAVSGLPFLLNDQDEVFHINNTDVIKIDGSNTQVEWVVAVNLVLGKLLFPSTNMMYAVGWSGSPKYRNTVTAFTETGQLWRVVLQEDDLNSGHHFVYDACLDRYTNIVLAGNAGFTMVSPGGQQIFPIGGYALQDCNAALCDTNGNIYIAGDARPEGLDYDFGLMKFLPNPTNDWDNDGMPNEWELTYFENPYGVDASADIDGDGDTTFEEYAADANPTSASSRIPGFVSTEVGALGALTVSVDATSTSRWYQVAGHTIVGSHNGTNDFITSARQGTGTNLEFAVTNSPEAQAYELRIAVP